MNRCRKYLNLAAILLLCVVCGLTLLACNDTGVGSTVGGKDTPIDVGQGDTDEVTFVVTVEYFSDVVKNSYPKDSSVTVTAEDVERKIFVGWIYQGEKVSEERNYTFTVTEDASLRSVYIDEYTVYLDAGEGTLAQTEIKVGADRDYLLPIPERQYHDFLGWKAGARFVTDKKGRSLSPFDFGRDITLVAEYKEKPLYTVKIGNGEKEAKEYIYHEGETVTFTAENLLAVDKKFVYWQKVGSENKVEQSELSFTVTENAEYTAVYETCYRLVIWRGPTVEINEYDEATEITVTTTDPTGKTFSHWIDSKTKETLSSDREFTFIVDKFTEISAVYDNIIYTLTYVLDGEEIKTEEYIYEQKIELYSPANPAHKHFSGWSENLRTMPAEDRTLTGSMLWDKHTVTVQLGTVTDGTVEAKEFSFDYGTKLTVMPEAYSLHVGKEFVSWKIDNTLDEDGGENGEYTFILEKDILFRAVYRDKEYKITYIVSSVGYEFTGEFVEGWTVIAREGVKFSVKELTGLNYNDRVTLEGTPVLSSEYRNHFTFSGWSNNGTPLRGSVVVPDGDLEIVGDFAVDYYKLSANGGLFGEETEITVVWNSIVTVTATPEIGKYFVEWRDGSGKLLSTQKAFSFIASENLECIAIYEYKTYTVKFVTSDVDDTEEEYETYNAKYGDPLRLPEKQPVKEYKDFGGWKYDGGEVPETVFDADDDIVLKGEFSWLLYLVGVIANGYISEPEENNGKFTHETSVKVKAHYGYGTEVADDSKWYTFNGWYENDLKVSEEEEYEFNPTANVSLSARYTPTDFIVTFYTNTDGGDYEKFDAVSFNINNNIWSTVLRELKSNIKEHYIFSKWHLKDLLEDIDENELIEPKDIDVFGEYTVKQYSVSVYYYNTDTKEPEKNIFFEQYNYNTTISLKAEEREGEDFSGWMNSLGLPLGTNYRNESYEIEHIDKDYVIKAYYNYKRYNILFPVGTVVNGHEGRDLSDGSYICKHNSTISFKPPKADDGYKLDHWTKDGEIIGLIGISEPDGIRYEITAYGNAEYKAVFVALEFNVTYRVRGKIVIDGNTVEYKFNEIFDFGDGTQNPQAVSYGSAVELKTPFVPEHYTFNGWYYGTDLQEKAEDGFTMQVGGLSLYGEYVIDKHTLTILCEDPDGEEIEGTSTSEEYDYGTKLTLIPAEITGRNFVKWIMDIDGVSTEVTDENYPIIVDKDIEIRAVYELVVYTLTYKTYQSINGVLFNEKVIATSTHVYGEILTLEETPAGKLLYVFGGWTLDGEVLSETFAMPACDAEIIGIYYFLFSFELTADGEGYIVSKGVDGDSFPDALEIPNTYEGKPVTEIKAKGFKGVCSKEIIIHEEITTVGRGAFADSKAESITLSDIYGGYIGYLFDEGIGSPDREHQILPETLTEINFEGTEICDYAFYGCLGLKTINFENATVIDEYAFYGCGITEVILLDQLISVGNSAFAFTPFVEKLVFNNASTNFGEFVFYDLGSDVEKGATFVSNGENIPEGFFEGMNIHISIVELNGVSTIGKDAFRGIVDLKTVDISSVTNIGEYAFYGTGIVDLTISGNTDFIAENAFGNISTLRTVNFNMNASAENAFVNSGYFDLSIGNSVEIINKGVFRSALINSLEFAEDGKIFEIAEEAFYGSSLTELTITETVQTIGRKAFSECKNLAVIKYNAPNIDGYDEFPELFDGSGKNIELIIGKEVEKIPARMFGGDIDHRLHITKVTFEEKAKSVCETVEEYAFFQCPIAELTLGENIITVEEFAFASIPADEILLPYSIIYIGRRAFANMEKRTFNLEVITARATWHEEWAYPAVKKFNYHCGALHSDPDYDYILSGERVYLTKYKGTETEIVLPYELEGFPVYSFETAYAGTAITSFTADLNLVNRIFDGAFAKCAKLERVKINGYSLAIGTGIFSQCTSLVSVDLPFEGKIPDNTFNGCTSFADFDLSTVTYIGATAFASTALTTADLSYLTYMGEGAFGNCVNLAEFTFNEENSAYKLMSGAVYEMATKTIMAYPMASEETVFDCEEEVEGIGAYAFDGAVNLNSLTLTPKINYIGRNAFRNCEGLREINYNVPTLSDYNRLTAPFIKSHQRELKVIIDVDVEVIPAYLFRLSNSSVGVTEIVINSEILTYVGESAFENNRCTELTVTSSIEYLGLLAFRSATIETVYYNVPAMSSCSINVFGSLAENATVILSSEVTVLPDYIFYSAFKTNVKNVYFEGSEQTEGAILVSENGLTIGEQAFESSSITELVLGENVDVKDRAFADIEELADVKIMAKEDYSGIDVFRESGDENTLFTFGHTVPANIFYTILSDKPLAPGKEPEVVLPRNVVFDGTEVIGENAFRDLPNEEFTFPDTLTTIGAHAYDGTAITSVVIPSGVTHIGEGAFANIATLTEIIYNAVNMENFTEDNGIFSSSGTVSKIDLTIGAEVKKIPDYAFVPNFGFNNIEKITFLGTAVTYIGDYAFQNSSATFENVSVGNITKIGEKAFENCIRLTEFTADTDETGEGYAIGNGAFDGCRRLASIELGNVISIGENAFKGCVELTSVDCVENVTSFGKSCFEGCTKLETITLGNITTISERLFYRCENVSVEIPETVTSIGKEAFYHCLNLNTAIPSKVTEIGEKAFYECWRMRRIDLGEKLTKVGDKAFYDCVRVEAINYSAPHILTSDGSELSENYGIFTNIGEIMNGATVTIGAKVEFIPDFVFAHNVINNLVFAERADSLGLAIGVSAFAYLALTEITIPSFVESIEQNAFYGCSVATELTLGEDDKENSLTFIGTRAFAYMTNLVTINYNVDNLGDNVFINAQGKSSANVFANSGIDNGLTLNIGSLVTEIKAWTFANTIKIDPVIRIKEVILGENSALTTIGEYAFADLDALTKINLTSAVVTVGNCAFENTSLSEIGDMSGLTEIGEKAFFNTELETVTLGENLINIGLQAFANIASLSEIIIECTDLALTDAIEVFSDSGENGITVTITDGSTVVVEEVWAMKDATSSALTPPNITSVIKGGQTYYPPTEE